MRVEASFASAAASSSESFLLHNWSSSFNLCVLSKSAFNSNTAVCKSLIRVSLFFFSWSTSSSNSFFPPKSEFLRSGVCCRRVGRENCSTPDLGFGLFARTGLEFGVGFGSNGGDTLFPLLLFPIAVWESFGLEEALSRDEAAALGLPWGFVAVVEAVVAVGETSCFMASQSPLHSLSLLMSNDGVYTTIVHFFFMTVSMSGHFMRIFINFFSHSVKNDPYPVKNDPCPPGRKFTKNYFLAR